MIESDAAERYELSELELAYVAGNLLSAGEDVRSLPTRRRHSAMIGAQLPEITLKSGSPW
jgi:hypothetical protein